MGSFDYPSDAWGYSVGATAELSKQNSTVRGGLFQMSEHPGSLGLQSVPFNDYGSILEFEQRTSFFGGRAGAFKALVFADTGYMGTYADAVALGEATNSAPSTAGVRNNKHVKIGSGLNFAQEIAPHVGVFARASAMNGTYESYDFTDIDHSLSGGISIGGGLYRRPYDAIGAAVAFNGLSGPAQHYFAAGGTGLLIGDGALSYGTERILETYYKVALTRAFGLTFDYQFIENPAYNTVRGPISIFGMRYHTQF
jgi:high affinity Mn2+ porin